ncbi:12624_t:CDS:2 [Entrophospora sp. SA101]|nr:12624_t:CDS:2 [Entrophospora sp. SA101]
MTEGLQKVFEHPKILDVDFGGGKNDVGRSDGRDNNNHKKSGLYNR